MNLASGELIDGSIQGWPASYVATRHDQGQGWTLHMCMYAGDNDEAAPEELIDLCWQANDACDGGSRADVIAAIKASGFVPDGEA